MTGSRDMNCTKMIVSYHRIVVIGHERPVLIKLQRVVKSSFAYIASEDGIVQNVQ